MQKQKQSTMAIRRKEPKLTIAHPWPMRSLLARSVRQCFSAGSTPFALNQATKRDIFFLQTNAFQTNIKKYKGMGA